MTLAAVTLDDKYTLDSGRVFLNGVQALVRLPMMQRQRDLANGLNTAGFISGYRGSPLGGYDQNLWRARSFLKDNHVHFEPGVNEDLAATAVWGSQQNNLFQGAKYDGVFSIWYGKGPGVDRCGDVFKHGNAAGSSKHGGVLVIAGDDHAAISSTLAHQSEHNFMATMMPVLNPANVQEYLDYGILGWEMSRFSGLWVGFIAAAETVESSASVYVDPHRVDVKIPEDFNMPPEGLNIRWPDDRIDQEQRLHQQKIYACLSFARANQLDKVVIDSPNPRFGIITTGKSYLDVRQALEDLGIDDAEAAKIGLRVYKVGMPWPLERVGARRFAEGLEEVLVIEEKRALLENQLKEQLYNWRPHVRPRIVGKFDEDGNWVLPSAGELTPARIARIISDRLDKFYTNRKIHERLEFLDKKERALDREPPKTVRMPYFCSGCPHNTSTKVPDGSRAVAGIGCHFMAVWMDRSTATFTQMGGEGVPWTGQAPFTDENHIFANLGDGTYHHSGLLAIRAAVAAGVNITYKILFNDAVAMTGGQPLDHQLTVPKITHQVYGEGVKKIVIVSDEPDKYPIGVDFAPGVTVHHRDKLDAIQKELREVEGCTVLIYDQTCAAEKRRRRKRGAFPDPDKRLFINARVCEGCGDCSVQSNCVSVEPLETEYGRKRTINQSACNKDYSCQKGFCPSFVTVRGAQIRKRKTGVTGGAATEALENLPLPSVAEIDQPYDILVTGIGGTGVITIGALLGMAAHLEGKGCSVLDMTGLAQKNGAVLSHVRISQKPEDINAVRIAAGGANLLLGCDMVVAGSFDALAKVQSGSTHAVINKHLVPTAAFTMNPDMAFHADYTQAAIRKAAGDNLTEFVEATRMATTLMGDAIATNIFMLGYAIQRGLVPVSLEAIERAIDINGVAVASNKKALSWGRLAAHDPKMVEQAIAPLTESAEDEEIAADLEGIIAKRVADLTAYQDSAYAKRFEGLVRKVQESEHHKAPGRGGLAEAVARAFYKLMAYKDEYEVARLFTDGEFERKLAAQFDGDYTLEFNLAPPLLAQRDPNTGQLQKRAFGPWVFKAFRMLAGLKGLRGGTFDIFGYTAERKQERQLIADYEATVAALLDGLNSDNHALAIEIAGLPLKMRGYGHVKEQAVSETKAREAELLQSYKNPAPQATAAE